MPLPLVFSPAPPSRLLTFAPLLPLLLLLPPLPAAAAPDVVAAAPTAVAGCRARRRRRLSLRRHQQLLPAQAEQLGRTTRRLRESLGDAAVYIFTDGARRDVTREVEACAGAYVVCKGQNCAAQHSCAARAPSDVRLSSFFGRCREACNT
jgi:hypothetical protein